MGTDFVEFQQTLKGRGLLLLGYFLLKMPSKWCLGAVRPEWLSISVPRKWDCMLEVGIALGSSTAGHGTMLHSPEIYFGLKVSM